MAHFDSHLLSHNHIQWVGSFLLSWITKLFVIYSVIHKRVFTPLRDISTSTIDSVNQTLNSTMTFTENVMPKHKIFCKCYCWILRMIDRRSWRGVKTLLWITRNYILANFQISERGTNERKKIKKRNIPKFPIHYYTKIAAKTGTHDKIILFFASKRGTVPPKEEQLASMEL